MSPLSSWAFVLGVFLIIGLLVWAFGPRASDASDPEPPEPADDPTPASDAAPAPVPPRLRLITCDEQGRPHVRPDDDSLDRHLADWSPVLGDRIVRRTQR